MAGRCEKAYSLVDPFARQLQAQYLRRRRTDIKALRDAQNRTDFAAIGLIGHKLFGSGSPYGLDEISRLGASLERAADTQDIDSIDRLVAQLDTLVGDLLGS